MNLNDIQLQAYKRKARSEDMFAFSMFVKHVAKAIGNQNVKLEGTSRFHVSRKHYDTCLSETKEVIAKPRKYDVDVEFTEDGSTAIISLSRSIAKISNAFVRALYNKGWIFADGSINIPTGLSHDEDLRMKNALLENITKFGEGFLHEGERVTVAAHLGGEDGRTLSLDIYPL